MDTIRVAVIGAGGLATREHYPALASFDDVELVAACDLDHERMTTVADRFGIEGRYTDYRRMIEDTAPDVVYVILRPHHAFDPAVFCLQAGLHIFIEKPPGVTSYQTRALAQLAEANGCLSMVGLNRRYSPLLRACRDLVLARGPMIQCVAAQTMHSPALYYEGAVDILYCHGIHYLDTLRWLGGDVTDLAGDVKRISGGHENCWTALMRHAGGCTGVLIANWRAGGPRPYTFEMHGAGVSVYTHMSGDSQVWVEGERVEDALTQFPIVSGEQAQSYFGFREENRRFIDCIHAGEQPETSLAEASRSMALADRVYAHQF
jgi:predicted dehydrogenase